MPRTAPQPALRPAPSAIGTGRRHDAFHLALMREHMRHISPLETNETSPADLAHLDEASILQIACRFFNQRLITPQPNRDMQRLIGEVGLHLCQKYAILPLRQAGSHLIIASARPEIFAQISPLIEARLGPVIMVLATSEHITDTLLRLRGAEMAQHAQNRVPPHLSCRTQFSASGRKPHLWLGLALICTPFVIWPLVSFAVLSLALLLSLTASTTLKAVALLAASRPHPSLKTSPSPLEPTKVTSEPAHLPKISLIIGLYKEESIANRLLHRIERLSYPRDRLEVVLAIEEEDHATYDALTSASIPRWMKIVRAPQGTLKTKPRALNIALEHSFGDIIGVYDAEDAPEADQLLKMVAHFAKAGPRLACLQGVLDFYNPKTNWLARCFTLEYGAWFRRLMPGFARLGLILPLGGTTFFIRREVLEQAGAWDAHNVTEDADLGVRLARLGYQTEMLASTTYEEANCRLWPWVKQRSRWIKGHMITWAVHMRHPRILWREIGTTRFIGLQIMFFAAAFQTILAPILWSFWALALGFSHPLSTVAGAGMARAVMAILLISLCVDMLVAYSAQRARKTAVPLFWLPSLYAYQSLACLAAYKALWEIIHKPFYWDKTSHGHFDTPESAPATGPRKNRLASRATLSLQPDLGKDLVSAASARPPRRANVFQKPG